MREYGRQYVLQIGEDDDALIFNNLRIAFSFSHTHDKTANTGTITIYNLSNDTVNQIVTGKADRYHQVTLSVGYGNLGDVRTLFTGQLTNAVPGKSDAGAQAAQAAASSVSAVASKMASAGAKTSTAEVDSTLVLTCDDGGVASREAVINTTFAAGSCHSDLVKACASTMTGVLPGLVGVASDLVLARGRVCYGMTRHVLTQIAGHHNADWSIQHGYLMIMACDYVRPGAAVVLNQQTGMIGAPKKSGDSVTVACLLRPEITIHSLVTIDSINDRFNGDYKVVDIKSEGDTHTDLWKSTLGLKLPESGTFIAADKANTAGGKA